MTTLDYLRAQHFERWSRYGDRFPQRVAEAFAGDLARAMTASDEEVLATVVTGGTADRDRARGAPSEHLRPARNT